MPDDARTALGLVAGGAVIGAALALAATTISTRRRRRTTTPTTTKSQMLAFEEEALRMDKRDVYALRKETSCAAQSISYENSDPLMIVQGDGQYLVDDRGLCFLDSRNNPACVGWQRREVVDAVSRQLAKTNSNTRYLHPYPALLARNLLATMPTGSRLKRVFFVNSGSEANDLALRLSRTHTQASDIVVVERAYHGNTEAVLAISPYKFLGKGGKGRPAQTRVVPCPDGYRERAKDESEAAFAKRMAAHVDAALQAIEEEGRRPAAFFVESGMSVAGVIMPPEGYLSSIYASVRARGAVCVADEVQVGFGRLGKHFWGFEQQGVDPDIVTLAKPFGNGVPLAAVVCSDEIAQSFTNGMEYFNTFGGNPVACAAGLAVLELIRTDDLQAHAARTGAYFRERLSVLMQTSAGQLIGDVRGSGLFLGIEFVRDRETKEPATKEVSFIVTRLLHDHRILTSCDGKHSNVLVIKPPLVFAETDVDTFVDSLQSALEQAQEADMSAVDHTPT